MTAQSTMNCMKPNGCLTEPVSSSIVIDTSWLVRFSRSTSKTPSTGASLGSALGGVVGVVLALLATGLSLIAVQPAAAQQGGDATDETINPGAIGGGSFGSGVILKRGLLEAFATVTWAEGRRCSIEFETPLSDEDAAFATLRAAEPWLLGGSSATVRI